MTANRCRPVGREQNFQKVWEQPETFSPFAVVMKDFRPLLAVLALTLAAFQSAQAAQDSSFIYTMSNNVSSNSVIAFKRSDNGSLTMANTYKTGGKGIAGDIDDQHSLRSSGDFIFAANPGSNDITVFRKAMKGLEKVGQYASGGLNPVSLAISGSTLVVANQAVKEGTPNLATFKIGEDGSLKMMGMMKSNFKNGAGPADVDFAPDGKMVAVTYGYQAENTSMVATFSLDDKGMLSKLSEAAAFGPVGLSWNPNGNRIYVSTFRSASILSFEVGQNGKLMEPQMLKDTEAAACWTLVNAAGDRLYVANFVSNSISIYSLDEKGDAKFMSAIKRPTVSGNDTKDLALSEDGKFLYVLGSTSKRIDAFRVADDGSLSFASSTTATMGADNWKGLISG
jgi:6-phosphogluconolactonase (cycloisomerase 2 family)